MVRRIDKYFSKFDTSENAFKDLLRRSMIYAPIAWDKLLLKIDKVGSLMFVFVSKSHIFGCYHYEACKVGEKGFEDAESGFFLSLRSKLDLQYYKACPDNYVVYNSKTKTISIGRQPCF